LKTSTITFSELKAIIKIHNFLWAGGILVLILLVIPLQGVVREWPESQMATTYSEGTGAPYLPMGGAKLRETTCTGHSTVFEVRQTVAKIPRHDVGMGSTELIVRSLKDNTIIIREILKEVWECLGFNTQTRKYLIISKNEHGVKVTLRGLMYFNEAKAAFQDSVFGKQHFEAVASLYSPDGNYLALIGAPEGRDSCSLYILNTISDQLQEIGKPPAPPPLTAADMEYPDAEHIMGTWESPERNYTELEKGIWEFSPPHMLRVSYGKDSLRHRNKDRTMKEWNLRTVFR
jgi:hypothetical protein